MCVCDLEASTVIQIRHYLGCFKTGGGRINDVSSCKIVIFFLHFLSSLKKGKIVTFPVHIEERIQTSCGLLICSTVLSIFLQFFAAFRRRCVTAYGNAVYLNGTLALVPMHIRAFLYDM